MTDTEVPGVTDDLRFFTRRMAQRACEQLERKRILPSYRLEPYKVGRLHWGVRCYQNVLEPE